jgi:hypothetical protein
LKERVDDLNFAHLLKINGTAFIARHVFSEIRVANEEFI